MTFDEFRNSGKDCNDLGAVLDDESLTGAKGRVYIDCLYISRWTSADPIAPPNGEDHWLLLLGNGETASTDLATLERALYDWAGNENYFS